MLALASQRTATWRGPARRLQRDKAGNNISRFRAKVGTEHERRGAAIGRGVAVFRTGGKLSASRKGESMTIDTIATWHRLLATRDVGGLDALLADDAVFHSPVVHAPQVGKALAQRYLAAAFGVFGNDSFHYVRELLGDRDAVLEFQVEIDGIVVNGVDMIRWNEDGRIVDFKVMIRPLKAMNLIHQKMAAMLQPMH
jgi:hypothetical protein